MDTFGPRMGGGTTAQHPSIPMDDHSRTRVRARGS